MKLGIACCVWDGTPLVGTFERPFKEWHCMTCGGWFEWLDAARATGDTGLLEVQHVALLARFRAGERGPTVAATKETP